MELYDCRTVVPNSAKKIHTDNDFLLYKVLLLRKGYDWFKHIAREKGLAVRDFDAKEFSEEDDNKKIAELKNQELNQIKNLQIFCVSTFSETFASWIHLKVIRAFVESVLRFGLPVDFSISAVRPIKGNEKKLLKLLEQQYSHLMDEVLKKPSSDNEIDYSGLSQEFYPFVYVPIKVDF